MNISESLSVGFHGIRSHKLRAVLTTLGVIFGVAAVIAMLSIGEGAKREALDQIKLMGMNNIIINDISGKDNTQRSELNNLSIGLTLSDAYSIKKINPLVDLVVPQRIIESEVIYRNNSVTTKIMGTTPDIEQAMNYHSEYGSFFNFQDLDEVRRVCVLGSELKKELFHFDDPVGKHIKIGEIWYTIIGVMQRKPVAGSLTSSSFDLNRNVYIPLSCALKRFSISPFASQINQIIIRVSEVKSIKTVSNIVNQTMNRRHNQIKDFSILIPELLLKQKQQTQRIFNIVMGAIASISLIVGGIGIMNIMLASVLERTREIGVRRAVGAKQNDILGQFLVEAVVLSFSGGILGLILGFFTTKIITFYAGWRTIISFPAILLAFAVSASIGIIFGLYPARKAAQSDPIESLRYE